MNTLQVLVEILIVLAFTFGCGRLTRRLSQPTVVGEIAGGLLLGPLVFGRIAPALQARVFTVNAEDALHTLSRIGLVLFLFLIGAELDLSAIRHRKRVVSAITAGSMLLPFAFGLAVAPQLWRRFPSSHGFTAFALLTGTAMSITALPVLASVLRERAASGHPEQQDTASIALLSASVNDALGWCVLSVLLVLVHRTGGWSAVVINLCCLSLFVAAMLYLMRPLLQRLLSVLPTWLMGAVVLVLAFSSARLTEKFGVHPFCGALLAGLCTPRSANNSFLLWMQRTFHPVIRLTLPLFFALTGLHMQPGVFQRSGLLSLVVIVVVAVTGKILGATTMARLSGLQMQQAWRLGLLLNTRGLVELILLDVGYREGIFTAALFTLFVLMALLTTGMTGPLLNLHEKFMLPKSAESQ